MVQTIMEVNEEDVPALAEGLAAIAWRNQSAR
jgi:hypothetical protein